MQRNAFTKFILSIFLTQGVITSTSNAALFNSDCCCSCDYDCPCDCDCSSWYIGEYIGNALGHAKFKTSVGTGTTPNSYFTSLQNIESVSKNGSIGLRLPGRTVWGIQAGYNCVTRNFIYGLATDFGFFNFSGSNEVTSQYPTFNASYTVKTEINTNWLWTTRARWGIQLCPCGTFIYQTGGFALAGIRVSNAFFDTAPSLGHGSSTNKSTKLGWVAGGGIELPFCKKFSANGEYLYTEFNHSTNTTIKGEGEFGAGLVSPFKTKAKLSAQIIRVGINYKF